MTAPSFKQAACPVCQSCKRTLAVAAVTGTHALCCECVTGGFLLTPMTAPSIKEALKPCPFCKGDDILISDNVELWGQESDQVYAHCCKCKANGPSAYMDKTALTKWNTRATISPPAGERREAIALAEMVYKAIKFTDEAAGEGLVLDGLDPADILCDYAQAIGTDCWDGMAEVARDAILASGLTSVPLVPREAMARMICEQLFGPFDAADLAETSVSGQSRKCADALFASGFVQDEAGWRPISTAPKDMTEIIVLCGQKDVRLGWYFAPSSTTFGWRDQHNAPIKPSQWMPLPAIRSARDGGAES